MEAFALKVSSLQYWPRCKYHWHPHDILNRLDTTSSLLTTNLAKLLNDIIQFNLGVDYTHIRHAVIMQFLVFNNISIIFMGNSDGDVKIMFWCIFDNIALWNLLVFVDRDIQYCRQRHTFWRLLNEYNVTNFLLTAKVMIKYAQICCFNNANILKCDSHCAIIIAAAFVCAQVLVTVTSVIV